MNKKFVIVGVVLVLAIAGIIIGVTVSKKSTSTSDKSKSDSASVSPAPAASAKSDNAAGKVSPAKGATTSSSGSSDFVVHVADSSSSGSSANATKKSKITSKPTDAKFTLAAFAVGDWGTTTTKDSCCKRRKGGFTNDDVFAEDIIAGLMNKQAGAADVKPKVVIGHGDNFYWTGINSAAGQAHRFQVTFEEKFSGENLKDIPWVNVMGNHDFGGSSYICSSGDEPAPCSSAEEIVEGLENKFKWQSNYKSPNGNRWIMKDHFYVHSIADTASNVSIDIFNIDTNDADAHGLRQICCQCYGYDPTNDCEHALPGEKRCAGGDMGMYNACKKKIMEWADDSRAQLLEKVKASTATWKIVNTHYSPYGHYDNSRIQTWFDLLKGLGVQVWIYGHTHGEKHDYAAALGTHFIENGAGGGIQSESASGIVPAVLDTVSKIWSYEGNKYGFFSLTASSEWLKVLYHTYPKGWAAGDSFSSSDVPSVSTNHCWYIPVDGGKGQVCDAKAEYPPAEASALED